MAIADIVHFLLFRNLAIGTVNTCEYETKSHNALCILLSRRRLGLGKYLTLGYKKESAARATIIQQWRASSTLSSTSTNTPHIFNASLLPAPLPSHHPLLIFFVRSMILNNFVFQMAFLIFRLLCLVLVLNLANCQLPNQLADLPSSISARSIYSHLYLRVLSPPGQALFSIW